MLSSETRRKTILVTAFMPFGGDSLNPAEMILEKLPDSVGGNEIRKLLLPVEFVRSREIALAEYGRTAPDAVVMLGQAGGRSAVTPETTAKNVMRGRIPDQAGFQPDGLPVCENGPETLSSTLPVQEIVLAVRAAGVPCEPSGDAGEYVCNSLFYSMLAHNLGAVPTGFIHVPFIREQGHADKPFMEFEDMLKGISAAVACVFPVSFRASALDLR